MFQINLPENRWNEIESEIPHKIFEIYEYAVSIPVEFILMTDTVYKNKRASKTDIAIICFQDACDSACDAVRALRYARAALIWFKEEHPKAPLKYEAAHYSKFYAADVTLRLYSAAEHIANFITAFLDISSDSLELYEEKFTSKHRQIGEYMRKNKPSHKITLSIQKLIKGNSWLDVIRYRNDWVHNQPPLIADTGIRRKRESMLIKKGDSFSVPLGRFEKPKYTIEEFLSLVTTASDRFVNFMSEMSDVLSEYIEEIQETSP